MRLIHYDKLAPVCPHCKQNGRYSSLRLTIEEETNNDIRSGLIQCVDTNCARIYPIIHGCPILVPDVESWLTSNLHLILQQEITNQTMENFIGEIVSPDIAFNITRQQQSSYCLDHYGIEFLENSKNQESLHHLSTIRRCLNKALIHMPNSDLPCIDIGCAVGGTTFEIANKRQALTIGIDLNWPLLNIARKILEENIISYPHRIVGNRYERRRKEITYSSKDLCDFWIADATCLPFREDIFGIAIALNIIDCLAEPQDMLIEIIKTVQSGGGASISCPFDWSSHTTNKKNWIYDEKELDKIILETKLLTHDNREKFLILKSPSVATEWCLSLHEYAKINYQTRLYALEVSI